MNMTHVLHRRQKTDTAQRPHRPTRTSPPSDRSPGDRDETRTPWPNGAKVLVAILIAATVLGALGTAVGFSSSDDSTAEQQLRDRIETLLDERDAALSDVAELDAELASLREQLADAQAGGEALVDQVAELEARIETLSDQRAAAVAAADVLRTTIGDLEGTIDQLEGTIGDLETDVDILEAALTTANQRVADAVARRDALAKLFPLKFDGSLATGDMVGTWDVKVSQIHCSGLANCTAPKLDDLTISRTSQGWLVGKIPGYVDGGFSRTGGALHMVAHSTTALPQVDGKARQAEITLTLFPGSYEIGDDGEQEVTSVAGVLTVAAPAVGGAPAVLAYYDVDLT